MKLSFGLDVRLYLGIYDVGKYDGQACPAMKNFPTLFSAPAIAGAGGLL